MSDPILWSLDDHTRAKHRVLRAYLDAWIPIMGQQSLRVRGFGDREPRLLLVDGFAGPGRYAGGEPGSPLIMLEALVGHKALPKLEGVQFIYLFIEKDRRRVDNLKAEVERQSLPDNVRVQIEHGAFELTLRRILDEVAGADHRPVPTFAFIDPFGYAQASMSSAGRLLDFPRSEALFFLPLTHIARFVARGGQEQALTSLFDTDEWRRAIYLEGEERRLFLLDLFEQQLVAQGEVEYVWSFALRTRDGNDYRLIFATGHKRGLEMIKRAMWSVDPEAGTQYVARTHAGQEVLFQPTVDTTPLLAELRSAFAGQWFSVAQATEVTLLHTPFLHDSHLKKRTLRPAERAGELVVEVGGPAQGGEHDAAGGDPGERERGGLQRSQQQLEITAGECADAPLGEHDLIRPAGFTEGPSWSVSLSRASGFVQAERSADMLGGDAVDPHDLDARSPTLDDVHPAARDACPLGDEPAQRLVGLSVERRGADCDLKHPVALADDRLASGARLQANSEICGGLIRLDAHCTWTVWRDERS